jgi:hypothetical protein
VGRAAGRAVTVPEGGIFIDKETNTAYVNANDWIALQDSPNAQGIRDLLGGADNDDALWLHPFIDLQDNDAKVLVWRSPNEPGDYVALRPVGDSDISSFNTPNGPLTFRLGDSSNLPTRRDRADRTYLGYVPDSDGSNLGKGQPYSIPIMDLAIRQEAKNAAVLGMYVNNLMVQKLVFGKTPDVLPAPLEAIVDASAKTGADLTRVKDWIFEQGEQFGSFGVPVPDSFQQRIAIERETRKTQAPIPVTENHWIDQLLGVVESHIETTRARADELREQAQAPASFFDAVFENPDDIYLGAQYNRTYGAALKRYERAYGPGPDAHNAAQLAAEAFLNNFDERQQRAILRGALVSGQMSERDASDAANWLQGHRGPDGRQNNSIANRTLDALTEVGLLGRLENVERTDPKTGRSYFAAVAQPPPQRNEPRVEMLTLQHATRFELIRQGDRPKEASKSALLAAQKRVESNTRQRVYDGMELTIRYDNIDGQRRAIAYSANGNPIGALPADGQEPPEGMRLTIRHAAQQANNLRIILENKITL